MRMRHSDIYNWYCVFHSVKEVLRHAANIRIQQSTLSSQGSISRKRRRNEDDAVTLQNTAVKEDEGLLVSKGMDLKKSSGRESLSLTKPHQDSHSLHITGKASLGKDNNYKSRISGKISPALTITESSDKILDKYSSSKLDILINNNPEGSHPPPSTVEVGSFEDTSTSLTSDNFESFATTPTALRSSKVPSSRIGRFFHYGGLAASLGYGAASEMIRRSSQTEKQAGSILMTEANLNRLVSKLSQMRGAALKMGQFMSIQDTHVLSADLERVFRRVQDGAHYMPNWQMESVMSSSLGPSWRSHFSSFTAVPSHAASIGQVHTGILAASSSPTGKEEDVAIKIQFPNVARSISSDLGYLKLLLGASALLPKGLFLDSTIKVFKEELADECDYKREADYIRKYGQLESMVSDSRYRIPWVWDGSTEQVLVMERMKGVSVGGDVVNALSQKDRDEIAARIIELCLRELFEFRMMQTDPNWTNFLWNKETRQIELIDFGATREYSKAFTDNWLGLLTAAIEDNRDACIDWSLKLKYFIGGENEAMINAHLTSMRLLGTPFRVSTPQPYSFAKGSEWTSITEEIRAQIPTMLNNRLTPPPRETYSLNRKLSGAFLLAGRLGARVDCRLLWDKVTG